MRKNYYAPDQVSYINTYDVGLFRDIRLQTFRRSGIPYLRYQLRRRNWRAIRSYFNGYLAEWHYPPPGMKWWKCGRGWTRRAALRRLGVHIARANAPELRGGDR